MAAYGPYGPVTVPGGARELLQHCLDSREKWIQALLESARNDAGWTLYTTKDSVDIYRKDLPGSRLKFWKGRGVINASQRAVFDYTREIINNTEYDKMCIEATLVKAVDDMHSFQYNSYRSGFHPIVYNRDFSLFASDFATPDGSTYGIIAESVLHPDIPDKSGFVRGCVRSTGFVFERSPDGQWTTVTYVVNLDPMGSIPSRVVNIIAVDQPLVVAQIRAGLAKGLHDTRSPPLTPEELESFVTARRPPGWVPPQPFMETRWQALGLPEPRPEDTHVDVPPPDAAHESGEECDASQPRAPRERHRDRAERRERDHTSARKTADDGVGGGRFGGGARLVPRDDDDDDWGQDDDARANEREGARETPEERRVREKVWRGRERGPGRDERELSDLEVNFRGSRDDDEAFRSGDDKPRPQDKEERNRETRRGVDSPASDTDWSREKRHSRRGDGSRTPRSPDDRRDDYSGYYSYVYDDYPSERDGRREAARTPEEAHAPVQNPPPAAPAPDATVGPAVADLTERLRKAEASLQILTSRVVILEGARDGGKCCCIVS